MLLVAADKMQHHLTLRAKFICRSPRSCSQISLQVLIVLHTVTEKLAGLQPGKRANAPKNCSDLADDRCEKVV